MGPHALEVFSPIASAWQLLEKSDGAPKSFYYDEPTCGIARLAITSLEPELEGEIQPLNVPFPSTNPPNDNPTNFHSSAPFSNVVKLQPCYLPIRGVRALTGMLLTHADGHIERLGHVRPYALEEAVDVEDHRSKGLYFKSSFKKGELPVLSGFGLGSAADDERRSALGFSGRGRWIGGLASRQLGLV